MTTSITLRSVKGSALTHDEMDANLTNLQTTADEALAATDTLTANKAEAAALGVANTDQNMGSFTGTTISDNVTAKVALQELETAVESASGSAATKANATAVGVSASASNMGTYTGSTLTDNQTAKQNIQELETAVEARAVSATLAATGGAALIGHDDGASGSLWSTVAGFITYLCSSAGSAIVGFIQSGTGAVTRTDQAKMRESVSVMDFGAVSDGITDDTTAINTAITRCLTSSYPEELGIPTQSYVTSSLVIDRLVDTSVADFNISGVGLKAPNAAMTVIDSSISVTSDPKSECVNFRDMGFFGTSAAAAAYVISKKFLRTVFNRVRFEKIKIIDSTIYLQSLRFIDTSAWRWSGTIIKATGTTFDIHLNNTRFEAGDIGLRLGGVNGMSVTSSLFEGSTGPFINTDGANGMFVAGNYTEGNTTTDYIFTDVPGLGAANGIVFAGNFMQNSHGLYDVKWGNSKAVSLGNYSSGNLHDVTNTRLGHFVSFGDHAAGTKFSNNLFWEGCAAGVKPLQNGITAFAGGGQASATKLIKPVNRITTVATANDSVALPPTDDIIHEEYAKEVTVINAGVSNLAVFYDPADTSNWGSPTTALATLTPGQARMFVCGYRGSWNSVT